MYQYIDSSCLHQIDNPVKLECAFLSDDISGQELALLLHIKARWQSEAAGESGQQLQQVKCSAFASTAGHLFESVGAEGHKLHYR